MHLNDYQAAARLNSGCPFNGDITFASLAAGLVKHAEEIARKVECYECGDYDGPEGADILCILVQPELGKMLWCLARLSDLLGCPLDNVAMKNIADACNWTYIIPE